jgi:hypothetical protein
MIFCGNISKLTRKQTDFKPCFCRFTLKDILVKYAGYQIFIQDEGFCTIVPCQSSK